MTKAPALTEKIQKATWEHKKRHQNFDYTTIADLLRKNHYIPATKLEEEVLLL